MPDYASRQSRLLETLTEDAFIAVNLEGSDPVSIRYLTGFTGEGAFILSRSHAALLTDSRYSEQARQEVSNLTIEETRRWNDQGLFDGLSQRNLKRITFASSRVSLYWHEELSKLGGLVLVAQRDPVAQLRLIKSADEVDCLREAARIAEGAFGELLPWIKIGMTEAEIALRLEMLIRQTEAEGVAFGVNVSTGPNTALNHYSPFHRPARLKAGDLLLFDFGADYQGYHSDITRTVIVGRPTPKARKIYDIVRAANELAIGAVAAGKTGPEVDAVARKHIQDAGYGEQFGHGLGHGLGMETHERPSLSGLSKDTLAAGMVATIEPGIYLPGYGGVRIEDDVVVTAAGCQVLTTFPKQELMSVG